MRRSRLLSAAVACIAGAAVVMAPAAMATDVDDAQRQVDQLGREVEIAAEDYNEVRLQADAQRAQAEAAAARVVGQAALIEQMQGELTQFAVESFKHGGIDPQLTLLLSGSTSGVSVGSSLAVMSERRATTLSELKDAQRTQERLQREQQAALAALEATEADLAARKADIEAKLDSAEGELAAAQAAAAARAAAAAQAARERAEAQASRSRAAASGGSSSSSSSSAGAASADVSFTASGSLNCGGMNVQVPNERAGTVLAYACAQMGKPYKWGSGGPNSFDCSGLTSAAYAQVGVALPHSSRAQAGVGSRVSRGNLQPGDLVFGFSPISHVGIYVGDGKIVAAPSAGDVVKIQSLQYIPFNGATRP